MLHQLSAWTLDAHVVHSHCHVVQAVFEYGYGTVLDSGTTFTYLPHSAFVMFKDAVGNFARAQGLTDTPGPDPTVSTPELHLLCSTLRFESQLFVVDSSFEHHVLALMQYTDTDVCWAGGPDHNDLAGIARAFPSMELGFDGNTR